MLAGYSEQSNDFVVCYFFIKAYVVGTNLNCLDLSRQFKSVPTTYAFIGTIRNEYRVSIINNHLTKSSANLSLKCALLLEGFPSNFEKP